MRLTLQWQVKGRKRTYSFEGNEKVYIGRDPLRCTVVLDDIKASRIHALILSYKGAFYIQNHSRRGHLSVNDETIAAQQSRMLRHGDRIVVGRETLRVVTIRATASLGAQHICSNCERPVNLSYGNCPYCGQNLASAYTRQL